MCLYSLQALPPADRPRLPQVDNGFLRLTMDLGGGPHSVENTLVKLDKGEWREVVVER